MKKKFDKEQLNGVSRKLLVYLKDELDIEPGRLEVDALVIFMSDILYDHHYNDALQEVLKVYKDRMERTEDDLLLLEKNIS